MTTITKEKTITYEEYQAPDGTIFKTRDECERYEKSYRCSIKTMMQKIPMTTISAPDCGIPYSYEDQLCYAIKMRNMNDLMVTRAWFAECFNDNNVDLTQDDIGKIVYILVGECEDWASIYRPEELLNSITKTMNAVMTYFKEKEN